MAQKCSCLGSKTALSFCSRAPPRKPGAQAIEEDVDYWRRVEREHLAHKQSAHDRDAERMPQFRSGARSQRQRQSRKESREGRHHDGTKAEQTGLINCLLGRLALLALRVQRK